MAGTTQKSGFDYRLLVVDDDPAVLTTSAMVLSRLGYEVHTARDGFAALVELRRSPPDIIISDLRMPNMSGFELLSIVRKRFPHIGVIVISGEYSGIEPTGLIADAFFSKGQYRPEELFEKIAELIKQAPLRSCSAASDKKIAPIWVPHDGEDYFVVTCTECLRSFSVTDEHTGNEVQLPVFLGSCDQQMMFTAHPSSVGRGIVARR